LSKDFLGKSPPRMTEPVEASSQLICHWSRSCTWNLKRSLRLPLGFLAQNRPGPERPEVKLILAEVQPERHPDKHGLAFDVGHRHDAPEAGVVREVAVVAHDEE